jgi:hypothetical protein
MVKDNNLEFIREKISRLRNAILYVNGSGLIKLGNDIATAVKVDDEGQLWFVTNHPAHMIEECEQSFPARLRFYRKGVDFFMEVSGKATIVNNDSSDYVVCDGSYRPKRILVKLAIANIEYTEPHPKRPKSKMEALIENGYNWFLRTVAVPHDSGSVLKKLRQTH